MRMRHTVICGLHGCTISPHYLINGTNFFKKKSLLHIKCVLFVYTTFACNISYSKNNWARYDKKRIFVVIFEIFSKNSQISNFMKIRPVGAEFFHADGRKDFSQVFRGSSYYLRTNISVFLTSNFLFTLPMKMEQTDVPKRRHKIQTPGNHPKERIQLVYYLC
jgi:hypothetical protein